MIFYLSITCLVCILVKRTANVGGFALNDGYFAYLCWQKTTGKTSTHWPQLQAQDWHADLEREWGGGCKLKLQLVGCGYSSSTFTNYTRRQYHFIVTPGNLTLTDTFLLFIANVSISTFLKDWVSSEKLALGLCAQGWRSLIKMLSKTHLSSNLYIMLTI